MIFPDFFPVNRREKGSLVTEPSAIQSAQLLSLPYQLQKSAILRRNAGYTAWNGTAENHLCPNHIKSARVFSGTGSRGPVLRVARTVPFVRLLARGIGTSLRDRPNLKRTGDLCLDPERFLCVYGPIPLTGISHDSSFWWKSYRCCQSQPRDRPRAQSGGPVWIEAQAVPAVAKTCARN